jgi:hypothetical protein
VPQFHHQFYYVATTPDSYGNCIKHPDTENRGECPPFGGIWNSLLEEVAFELSLKNRQRSLFWMGGASQAESWGWEVTSG